jgi:peptidyl-prolyl cis-trans isomerase A (cyclophilin A)
MYRTLLPIIMLTLALTACSSDSADASDEPETPQRVDATDTGRAATVREVAASIPQPTNPAQKVDDAAAVEGGEAVAATEVEAEAGNPALKDPSLASKTAPAKYTVKFETTKGDMFIDVTRSWAPNGADRFYNLVEIGYYDDIAFFRVIGGFMAQLGIHGDPAIARVWKTAKIDDDPVNESNTTGMVTFATAGPDTRTTQIFMNLGDNSNLDSMGFSPFGKLRDAETLNKIYDGYGEGAPRGRGPHQGRLQTGGNEYLKASFPNLDYIVKATIVE